VNTPSKFWDKVNKTDDCWLWEGSKDKLGYGRLFWMNGSKKIQLAHRVSYLLTKGFEPKNVLDHLCRNPSCVRPDHLEDVTQKENILRGQSLQAINARKTLCFRGHEYDIVHSKSQNNRRACSKCRKIHNSKNLKENR